MKITNGILGCALATGLMTFAAGQANAGVVIDDTLYTPMNLKLTATYQDENGKFKKASVTSKTILNKLGFKGTTLALQAGEDEDNDVFVINKSDVLENLTEDGIMTAELDEYFENSTGSESHSVYTETGVLFLALDSDGNLNSEPAIVSHTAPTSFDGDYSFNISGVYSYTEKFSDSNDSVKVSTSFKASALTGSGFDSDINDEQDLPVTGSFTGSGSGKVEAP